MNSVFTEEEIERLRPLVLTAIRRRACSLRWAERNGVPKNWHTGRPKYDPAEKANEIEAYRKILEKLDENIALERLIRERILDEAKEVLSRSTCPGQREFFDGRKEAALEIIRMIRDGSA